MTGNCGKCGQPLRFYETTGLCLPCETGVPDEQPYPFPHKPPAKSGSDVAVFTSPVDKGRSV